MPTPDDTGQHFRHINDRDTADALRDLLELQRDNHADNTAALARLEALIKSGFPDENPAAHKLAHEAWMKAQAKKEQFYENLKSRSAFGMVYALLGFVGIAIWKAFVELIGRSFHP